MLLWVQKRWKKNPSSVNDYCLTWSRKGDVIDINPTHTVVEFQLWWRTTHFWGFFPSPTSAFTFSFFFFSFFFNLPRPSCKVHTGKHLPLLSEGLTRWSPHPVFALTSIDLSSWATVEECIRFRARVPARSLDATPFSLPVMPPLTGHRPSVSWCICLFMSRLVEGDPSTSLTELKLGARFTLFIWYAGGAAKLGAGFVPVWHRKWCLSNPAVGKSSCCCLRLLVSCLAHDQDFPLALVKWDSPSLGWHPYSLVLVYTLLFRELGCAIHMQLSFRTFFLTLYGFVEEKTLLIKIIEPKMCNKVLSYILPKKMESHMYIHQYWRQIWPLS